MKILWPNSLINDIARKKCVIFLGSGISRNSTNAAGFRPKTWAETLESGLLQIDKSFRKDIKKHIQSKNFLMACELIRHTMGRDNFVNFLRKEFVSPRFNEADIHKAIFELDSRIVITPNFDNIYDVYVRRETQGTTLVKKYYDTDVADAIRGDNPLILKIHGDIDSPDKLIFTKIDYAKARTEYNDFYSILEALLLTNTFIFIGAGLNDPDIALLLEDYNFKYGFTRKHYFVIPKNELSNIEREIYEKSMGLQFIEYDSKNSHIQLTEGIRDLNKIVEEERRKIFELKKW